MKVLRFDFNGTPNSFKRTAQGFLRVQARLSKTGVFSYNDQREYRADEELFRTDSLDSIKGAPVTDLHPKEKGEDNFLTPANIKEYIIGITENVEREGQYLKGSLIIFDEDAIMAIESGERKEISLGFKCNLEQTPGNINGENYDSIQRNIIVNHVAIGPKGWGRAGADCSIRTDSKNNNLKKGEKMDEVIHFDGIDIALNSDSIKTYLVEKRKQLNEIQERLDAANIEIDNKKSIITALEGPKAVNARVNTRIKLLKQCQEIIGDDECLDSLSDEELKLLAIKKHYPNLDIKDKDQGYIDGIFDALATKIERNDSLGETRKAIHNDYKNNIAYEKWLNYSANLSSIPLAGSSQGGR